MKEWFSSYKRGNEDMCVVNLAIGGLSVRLQMDICSLKTHILVRHDDHAEHDS